jgi:hypothetical protein
LRWLTKEVFATLELAVEADNDYVTQCRAQGIYPGRGPLRSDCQGACPPISEASAAAIVSAASTGKTNPAATALAVVLLTASPTKSLVVSRNYPESKGAEERTRTSTSVTSLDP